MNNSKTFPLNKGPKSTILVPCPKHGKIPDMNVCGGCLSEMGEFCVTAQETLKLMPVVYSELFEEGMDYFQALVQIANPNTACLCSAKGGDGTTYHDVNCGVGVAQKALHGYENRVLHRPATGKLAEMKKDIEKAQETAQKSPHKSVDSPKLETE